MGPGRIPTTRGDFAPAGHAKAETLAHARTLRWQAVAASLLTLGVFSWLALPRQTGHAVAMSETTQGVPVERGLPALGDAVTVTSDFLNQLGGFFAQAGNFDFTGALGGAVAGTGPS
jgi:hypothetical protein